MEEQQRNFNTHRKLQSKTIQYNEVGNCKMS